MGKKVRFHLDTHRKTTHTLHLSIFFGSDNLEATSSNSVLLHDPQSHASFRQTQANSTTGKAGRVRLGKRMLGRGICICS